MLIRNNIVLVYDIEIFPNIFLCGIKNTENKKIVNLEISERRNNLDKLITILFLL